MVKYRAKGGNPSRLERLIPASVGALKQCYRPDCLIQVPKSELYAGAGADGALGKEQGSALRGKDVEKER